MAKIREDQFIEQDQILIEIKKGTNNRPQDFSSKASGDWTHRSAA
jgi:hypothetical protein